MHARVEDAPTTPSTKPNHLYAYATKRPDLPVAVGRVRHGKVDGSFALFAEPAAALLFMNAYAASEKDYDVLSQGSFEELLLADNPFAIDDRIVTVDPENVPRSGNYGCGDDTCLDCYPVLYRCEHGIDYPRPLINNTAARAAQLEDCKHHDEIDED